MVWETHNLSFSEKVWKRGVDRTLFMNRSNEAQIYIDDIVFGAISSDLALSFVKEIKIEFEMSMVGELTSS